MKRPPVLHSSDWRRDLKTFVAGAGCGFLAGSLLVATVLWQYRWIAPPWTARDVVARQTTDPGTRGIELERPTATVGRPAVGLAPEAVI